MILDTRFDVVHMFYGNVHLLSYKISWHHDWRTINDVRDECGMTRLNITMSNLGSTKRSIDAGVN